MINFNYYPMKGYFPNDPASPFIGEVTAHLTIYLLNEGYPYSASMVEGVSAIIRAEPHLTLNDYMTLASLVSALYKRGAVVTPPCCMSFTPKYGLAVTWCAVNEEMSIVHLDNIEECAYVHMTAFNQKTVRTLKATEIRPSFFTRISSWINDTTKLVKRASLL